jgi:hypothetical protein
MAIPAEPLKLSVEPEQMTLNDLELFEGGFTVKGFKAFMAGHSNWSAAQVGLITVAEMKQVTEQIREALKDSALPKATPPA